MKYHVATFHGIVVRTYKRKHFAEKLAEKINRENDLKTYAYIVIDDEQLQQFQWDEWA